MADADYLILAIKKNNIDREAHEHHVHPHQRQRRTEEHASVGGQAIAAEQSAASPTQTSRYFQPFA